MNLKRHLWTLVLAVGAILFVLDSEVARAQTPTPARVIIYVYGRGGIIIYPNRLIRICPIRYPRLCAIIRIGAGTRAGYADLTTTYDDNGNETWTGSTNTSSYGEAGDDPNSYYGADLLTEDEVPVEAQDPGGN